MRDKIERYLVEEKKIESTVVREMLVAKVMKYEDIAADFVMWLEKRNYADMKVAVGDWTAQGIYEVAPALDGIGVFNFLVTLRDNPEEAKRIIREGFVVR